MNVNEYDTIGKRESNSVCSRESVCIHRYYIVTRSDHEDGVVQNNGGRMGESHLDLDRLDRLPEKDRANVQGRCEMKDMKYVLSVGKCAGDNMVYVHYGGNELSKSNFAGDNMVYVHHGQKRVKGWKRHGECRQQK